MAGGEYVSVSTQKDTEGGRSCQRARSLMKIQIVRTVALCSLYPEWRV